MTIVDGPVGLVEEAGTVQKVSEARTLETMLAPSDLGRGATPGLPLEHRPVALGEFPVETGVVCDDYHRILDECRNGSIVRCPATISVVMPVRVVTSAGMGEMAR